MLLWICYWCSFDFKGEVEMKKKSRVEVLEELMEKTTETLFTVVDIIKSQNKQIGILIEKVDELTKQK